MIHMKIKFTSKIKKLNKTGKNGMNINKINLTKKETIIQNKTIKIKLMVL